MTPCYNEAKNVEDLHAQIVQVMSELPEYEFEHIYIDNASTDGTVPILRRLAAADSRVKVILNARNFGHIRSPFHGILQAHGDAVICMSSDLQDPPSPDQGIRQEMGRGLQGSPGSKDTEQGNPAPLLAAQTLLPRAAQALGGPSG